MNIIPQLRFRWHRSSVVCPTDQAWQQPGAAVARPERRPGAPPDAAMGAGCLECIQDAIDAWNPYVMFIWFAEWSVALLISRVSRFRMRQGHPTAGKWVLLPVYEWVLVIKKLSIVFATIGFGVFLQAKADGQCLHHGATSTGVTIGLGHAGDVELTSLT